MYIHLYNLILCVTKYAVGEPLLELLPPLPIRAIGRSPFNVTVNGFDVNRFGRTVRHIRSQSTFVIMYKSPSLSQQVSFNFITDDILSVNPPLEFYSTYDPNQNTSYFEITFVAPSRISNATISFSVEYFGMFKVNFEIIAVMCEILQIFMVSFCQVIEVYLLLEKPSYCSAILLQLIFQWLGKVILLLPMALLT